MQKCLTFQELGIRNSANQLILGSIENALEYLNDNFVIGSKLNIRGIAARLCYRCGSINFRYVEDIESDNVSDPNHICVPLFYETNVEGKELLERAGQLLVMAVNSVFSGDKYLEAKSHPDFLPFRDHKGPRIILDWLIPESWAWLVITGKGKIELINEKEANDMVKPVLSTFVLVSVLNGDYSGHHLVYIITYNVG